MSRAEAVVSVEDVSKRYSRSFKHALWYGAKDVGKEIIGRGQAAEHLRPHEFWALRNISFEIGRGESVGLIGHNGADKTTLLKLIHGLIKPNGGEIIVNGSVRALIALGAGFNPVLTGRENVRVASAVLGYGTREADARFDEIVEFSDIGEFIDAPVQSYSSGMLARLGFAVAVHTRPDILLVDEVLAVGDLNFAMKCFRKIAEFRSHGGSIVLVSHNPFTIRTNCDRVIWIEHGALQRIGPTQQVCDAYERAAEAADAATTERLFGEGAVRLTRVVHPEAIRSGEGLELELTFSTTDRVAEPIFGISFATPERQYVVVNYANGGADGLALDAGETTIRIAYASMPLVRGRYSVNVTVADRYPSNQVMVALNCGSFEIQNEPEDYTEGIVDLRPLWTAHPLR